MSEPKSFGRADRLYQCRPRMRSVGVDQHPRTGPHSPEHPCCARYSSPSTSTSRTPGPDSRWRRGVALSSEPTSCPQPATAVQAVEWAGSVASRGVRRSDPGTRPAIERRERRGAGPASRSARVPQTSGRHRTGGVRNAAPTSTESLSAAGRRRTVTVVRRRCAHTAVSSSRLRCRGSIALPVLHRPWSGTWDHCCPSRRVDAATDERGRRLHVGRGQDARGVAGVARAPGRRVVRRRRRCVRHPPHRRAAARDRCCRRRRRRTGAPPTRCGGRRREADRPGCRTPRRPECR